MNWKRRFRLALASLLVSGAAASARAAPPAEYARMEHAGVVYHVLKVAPEQLNLRWKDERGEPLRTMARVKAAEEAADRQIVAIVNGGIFEPGGVPSGLYMEGGVELRPLNLEEAPGNFFLKPNGVFYLGEQGAGVLESIAFSKLELKVRAAVQSGPLLLNKGQVHPKFSKTSTNRLHRNGVGIEDATGRVVLVMSEFKQKRFPTLYEFAEFYRSLACRNALFLDGDISEFYIPGVPELERLSGNNFGSFVIVNSAQDVSLTE